MQTEHHWLIFYYISFHVPQHVHLCSSLNKTKQEINVKLSTQRRKIPRVRNHKKKLNKKLEKRKQNVGIGDCALT